MLNLGRDGLELTGGSPPGFLAAFYQFGYALKNKKFIVVVPFCITDTDRRGGLILKKKGLAGIVLKRF